MQLRTVPQQVYDISLDFGNDLTLGSNADLATVSLAVRGQQRVLRRLLTNPGGYIWYPAYGAGLAAYVGQALSPDVYDQINSTILSQIFLEPAVAQEPAPVISLQTIQSGLFAQIEYTDNPTQNPVVITFNTGVTT